MKIAIIGGGAAGCFAAANIPAGPDHEVVVYEKTGKLMQKVKASGGGRCNVTHDCIDPEQLSTYYPRGRNWVKKSAYDFGPADTIAWFEARGVALKTEPDGRMFPVTDDSQSIIDCIRAEMLRKKVAVCFHKPVEKIIKQDDGFVLRFADGSSAPADRVLVTTGGAPRTGQYHWLEELGHTIAPPVPSLFTFNMPQNPITQLMGVAVADATVKIQGTKIETGGPVLITHWGLSGPAILRASAFAARELAVWNYEFDVLINWAGDASHQDLKDAIESRKKELGKQLVMSRNLYPEKIPRRLWEYLAAQSGIADNTRWGELKAPMQKMLTSNLIAYPLRVTGKTTFKEEFVTCGGVTPAEIDRKSMESKVVDGLFFAGEVMDIDGVTGGFNFQHAWNSAWIAANHISKV